jgi:hypothetical protein
MTTKQTVLGLVLGVVVIGGVAAWYLWPASPTKKTAAPAPAPGPAPAAAAVAGSTNAPAASHLPPVDRTSLESRWLGWVRAPLRDPFLLIPPPPPKEAVPVTPASSLQLSALWLQSGSRLAVINQAVCGEGDTIQGFKILRIDPDKVLVQGPDKTETINFTSYIPGAVNSKGRGTNWVETFLGPEKENLRY